MTAVAEAGQDFWRDVLVTGGRTTLPRWTLQPIMGIAEHDVALPASLLAALHRFAEDLAVPLSSVLLAAHAKVLAALSGDREVTVGYVTAGGGGPLPCPLTTEPVAWRGLVLGCHRLASDLLRHKEFPVEDLRRHLGLTEVSFETAASETGHCPELARETVAAVGIEQQDQQFVLRLRYRTEAWDAAHAARVAGYHVAALGLMATNPDGEHVRDSLISNDERHFQIEGLAGPFRELPRERFHELFEGRVRARPDAVAAVFKGRQWTYGELNARANKLAHALLHRGLRPEDVVAVVTERNLDWMAAVLAIFKAGGVYLPIEPHFPADRIATMLTRARCRIVLTELGSTPSLDHALRSLSGVEDLLVTAAYEEQDTEGNPGIDVAPDQLAYIYFTSGSTGEPKGAMVEHAGMLNHLLAKVEDLAVVEGRVVAQTAPQCFDISLWQLMAPLLVGARTVIIEQDVVLDVERFVDKIIHESVTVLQVVPSYLEAVVSYLEQVPHTLADLRYVSVTGETLKKELAQRWFAVQPGIKLVNAYGLTETSDDTNHEVMDQAPGQERVPLGRPINNVYVYVVDENLEPVPLGAPGAIVFSGVCVGRGYVNDPDRTRLAYLADPHRPGERIYRGGDYGRWLPDGKLDFLGRRDNQVKLSGFRIEIDEIENALLSVPGVHDGAVVVAERGDHTKHLLAFYSSDRQLEADVLHDQLARSLPQYMVPSVFHWLEGLPLTSNGKINRRRLAELAANLDVDKDLSQRPTTATEERLTRAWSTVLGIPEEHIGRLDDFFDRGGTSLAAVKLVITLDRSVSLKDVTRYPVLADLAALMDGRPSRQPDLPPPGGHFIRTGPTDAAQAVRRATEPLAYREAF
ncbi:MAG TPA: amino acid adenylation domain-containing protein [Propionibacteriaceae bacterium]|nr:amino acid adenylation domain-containing protein [Propionibacteriaceae bacterium]